jgi:hypothetical protein
MSPRQDRERQEMLLGTLDMLILRTLRMGAGNGTPWAGWERRMDIPSRG